MNHNTKFAILFSVKQARENNCVGFAGHGKTAENSFSLKCYSPSVFNCFFYFNSLTCCDLGMKGIAY